jgi:hypothetical protein
MRQIAIALAAVLLAGGLAASDLTRLGFGESFTQAKASTHSAFPGGPDFATLETAFTTPRHLRETGLFRAQLIDDSGPGTDEQMFGAGVALGFHSEALGLGVSGWFDFHFLPYLAVSSRFHLAYGILTREYKDGGTALNLGLGLGVKFVLDVPDLEVTRWLRPWVALYPAGFVYVAATEDFDPPGPDSKKKFSYSDIFYLIQAGTGVDFFLTNMIGLGLGVYITGTVGGSKHEKDDTTIRTRGSVGVYFEYARLSLRF